MIEKIIRILINYKIKFLVPFLLSVGMVVTSIGIIFVLYFFTKNTLEHQITESIHDQRNIVLEIYKNQPQILFSNKRELKENYYREMYLSTNHFYYIFIIDPITKNVLFSNDDYFTNKIFDQILNYYSKTLSIEWKDILIAKSNIENSNKKIAFNKNDYFIYVEELEKNHWLIILYNFNWFHIFNIKNISILFLIFSVIVFAPFIFFLYVYKKIYQTRIDFLIDCVERISRGDLAKAIPIIGNDEISQISYYINEMRSQLKEVVYEDSLTKMLNRRGFEYFASLMLNHKKKYAVFFMDLDGFKFINETYGHKIGDEALKIISKRFLSLIESKFIPSRILLGRIGGDEFAMMIDLSPLNDPYLDLQIFALKIIDEVSKKLEIQQYVFHLGVSIGVAIYPEHGNDLNTLLTHADLAMYQIKYSTKNSYYFFDSNLKSLYEEKNLLRNELITIFRNQAFKEYFYLVYQPIYDLKLKRISHLEVLLRFHHPYMKATPTDFIPLLEELNYITEIGNFIIEKSILEFVELQNYVDYELKLSINISTKQITDKNFYKAIINQYKDLSQFNLKNHQIIFEITESIFFPNFTRALRVISSISDLGFLFALDHFGTGYSALAYLKDMPLKYIKIDKRFCSDIVVNPKSQLIVRNIINLAHLLQMQTIVEGVEDLITMKKLIELGADYIQGYYVSSPLKKEELIAFIKEKVIV